MKQTPDLPTITVMFEGKKVPFDQFLKDMSGSGTVYESDIRKIFKSWNRSDWIHAAEYIAPIASEVIIDCSEDDRELYNEIMNVIEKAYEKLYQQANPETPNLTRIK